MNQLRLTIALLHDNDMSLMTLLVRVKPPAHLCVTSDAQELKQVLEGAVPTTAMLGRDGLTEQTARLPASRSGLACDQPAQTMTFPY
jgi:hypothetical protein